ncbi:MAG: G1 family glutamic endopeptidase [Acidimicrobiales bacterium]
MAPAKPVITEQPKNQAVLAGASASFTAAASGTPTPSVQWQYSSNGGTSWANASGASSTSPTYSFTASSTENGYEYEAVFTNSEGSATTNPATLTVGSSNWSGYVDTGGTFTSVSGDWTVPTATCTSGKAAYSSTWIGIDGDGNDTVEQDGIEADCSSSNQASYHAWYEMYGDNDINNGDEVNIQTKVPSDKVYAGDAMSASVSVVDNEWTLEITDSTQGWTYTPSAISFSAAQESAEWIVERPEVCDPRCALTALADFGSVTFTSATATNDGTSGSISAFSASATVMIANNGTTVLATPGPLSASGENFTDNWDALGP